MHYWRTYNYQRRTMVLKAPCDRITFHYLFPCVCFWSRIPCKLTLQPRTKWRPHFLIDHQAHESPFWKGLRKSCDRRPDSPTPTDSRWFFAAPPVLSRDWWMGPKLSIILVTSGTDELIKILNIFKHSQNTNLKIT